MARAIWTGELVFGKVRVPVRLEGVVQDKSVKTHLVHREDHGRLQMKRFCRKCGGEIEWGDAARAVEVGNREVVDFEPEELKELKVQREEEIVLSGFAEPASVDPVYFDRTYAIVPIGKQPRAFELLASMMRQSGRIAVTRVGLSGRSYPAVLRVRGAELILHTLHYGDEVREARERPDPQLRPSSREMGLAVQLVEHMTAPFDPRSTEDPYRMAVEEIAAGRKPRPIDEEAARRKAMEQDAEVLALMSALQRSLQNKPERGTRAFPRPRARRRSIAARPAARRRRSPKPPSPPTPAAARRDKSNHPTRSIAPDVAPGHG